MVRENMRSPRAVFHYFVMRGPHFRVVFYSGSTPGLAPTLRDVTVLFFRLLLKKTVLSQSEGHLNLLNPRPRGGTPFGLHRWFSGKINGCQSEERARIARVPL